MTVAEHVNVPLTDKFSVVCPVGLHSQLQLLICLLPYKVVSAPVFIFYKLDPEFCFVLLLF